MRGESAWYRWAVPRVIATSTSAASRAKPLAVLLAVALSAPLFAARAWSMAYADRLALAIASNVSALVPNSSGPTDSDGDAFADLGGAPPIDTLTEWRALSATNGKARGRGHSPAVTHGIRISASQVLALAARRAMPQAVPVKASALHPAGLLLQGVSALGVGLQDGDVLTEAAGQKATSVAAVVGIVLAARGRQVPEISGKFYRGGVPFALSVEQPYPKALLPG